MKEINKIIELAKKDKEVVGAILFGSYARGEEYNDIDICLVLKPKKYSNLSLSKKRMKYSLFNKIDVQIFQQLPIYIRIRILKEGKVILEKDYNTLYDIAYDTVKDFEYFKKIYYSYLEGVEDSI